MNLNISSKKIIALLILLAIIAAPVVIYFLASGENINSNSAQADIQESQNNFSEVESYAYTNDELGFQMNVPKSWGNIEVENDFSGTQILKTIRFSKQPRVTLTTLTPKRLYPADFRGEGIAPNQDIIGYCESQVGNPSTSEEDNAAEDLFRLNGDYYFGECETMPPHLNRAQKESEETGAWIPVEDETHINSKIDLSKSYFWPLENPLYPALTLRVELPTIQTDGFCLNHQTKSFRCMNHFEKTLVDSAFERFSDQVLYEELEYVANTLQITPQKTAQEDYEAYFSEWSTFEIEDLGIQLNYPRAFGEPEYDAEKGRLEFPEDDNQIFQLQTRTLEQVENEFEALETCEGPCIEPQVSKETWEFERNQLENENADAVECRFGRGCALAEVGEYSMLVRYFNQWPITDGFRKEYTFYLEGTRFDIYLKSDEAYTGDVEEFKAFETTDFTLQLLEKIVESIKIIEVE